MQQRSRRNLGLLIGLLILMSACSLEPIYVTLNSAANDGAFTWVKNDTAAPDGYAPVLFSPPEGSAPLAVCRAEVIDPGFERGLHPGMLVSDTVKGITHCWVGHRGRTLRFNEYEQLWAQAGAVYRWEAYENSVATLVTTEYYHNNRVVNEPMTNIPTGRVALIWHPCADEWQGTWYLGKVSLGSGPLYGCELPIGEVAVGTRGTALLFYAPIDAE